MTSVIEVYVQTLLQLKLLKEENKQNTWHVYAGLLSFWDSTFVSQVYHGVKKMQNFNFKLVPTLRSVTFEREIWNTREVRQVRTLTTPLRPPSCTVVFIRFQSVSARFPTMHHVRSIIKTRRFPPRRQTICGRGKLLDYGKLKYNLIFNLSSKWTSKLFDEYEEAGKSNFSL